MTAIGCMSSRLEVLRRSCLLATSLISKNSLAPSAPFCFIKQAVEEDHGGRVGEDTLSRGKLPDAAENCSLSIIRIKAEAA